jgi:hypothetical protein
MSWYVEPDGKTVHRWKLVTPDIIRLENGTELDPRKAGGTILAVDPDENPRMTKVDGVYHFDGQTLREDEG